MKAYNEKEVNEILNDLTIKINEIEKRIEDLKKVKSSARLFDYKKRKELTEKISHLLDEEHYLQTSNILFLLYSDQYIQEPKSYMSDEKLIKIENEASMGDGLSKMIIFHHKCFVEKTIVSRDFLRLKYEARSGNITSLHILRWFLEYFEDGKSEN